MNWLTSLFSPQPVVPNTASEIGSIQCAECSKNFLVHLGETENFPSYCCYCGVKAGRLVSIEGNPTQSGKAATITTPKGGTLEINKDGTYSYTPTPGFVGTEEVTVPVDDGKGGVKNSVYFLSVYDNSLRSTNARSHTDHDKARVEAVPTSENSAGRSANPQSVTDATDAQLNKVLSGDSIFFDSVESGTGNPKLRAPKSQWPAQIANGIEKRKSSRRTVTSVDGAPVFAGKPTTVLTSAGGMLQTDGEGSYTYTPHSEFVGLEEISVEISDDSDIAKMVTTYIAVLDSVPRHSDCVVYTAMNNSTDGNLFANDREQKPFSAPAKGSTNTATPAPRQQDTDLDEVNELLEDLSKTSKSIQAPISGPSIRPNRVPS